jgi:hypothetical protein
MYTMHLLPSEAIKPNLELKTRPKQLLGSLLLVIVLQGALTKFLRLGAKTATMTVLSLIMYA